jgi:hypothetical protein
VLGNYFKSCPGRKNLVLDLEHGLGNQLSLYFAGLAYSMKFDLNLTIRSRVNQGENHDSFRDIQDLTLPGLFLDRRDSNFKLSSKLSQFLAYRFPPTFHVTGRYYSSIPGFDRNLLSIAGIRGLHGFFHTYAYFDFCKARNPELTLEKILPLGNYASSIVSQLTKPNAVAIHIRRGDYLSHSKSIGILGVDYYKNSIARVETFKPHAEYFVFSDDHTSALEITTKLGISPVFFPENHGPLKASEVIHLLAISSNLIIANSSMSYWAAVLADSTRSVIAPAPFYRNHQISESFFYRPSWTIVDANFGIS